MVRHLLAVRATSRPGVAPPAGPATSTSVKDEALRAVNEYFERRLFEVPSIKAYVDGLVPPALSADPAAVVDCKPAQRRESERTAGSERVSGSAAARHPAGGSTRRRKWSGCWRSVRWPIP